MDFVFNVLSLCLLNLFFTKSFGSQDNFLKIIQAPKVLQNNCSLFIEFLCTEQLFLKIQVVVSNELHSNGSIFKHVIKCHPSIHSKTKWIKVKLPRYIAYKPSHSNKYSLHVNSIAFIRVWFTPENKKWWLYEYASIKDEVKIRIDFPYERPTRKVDKCYNWWALFVMQSPYAPTCPIEEEVVSILTYPLALSGQPTGIVKQFQPFKNKVLDGDRKKKVFSPSFSYVMWVFIVDYCPSSSLCSLMHHATWDANHLTPIILINRRGQIHLEMLNGTDALAYKTTDDFIVPLNTWVQIIVSYNPNVHWSIAMSYGPNMDVKKLCKVALPSHVSITMDDTAGIHYFGGSDLHFSFKGYFGDIKFYRRLYLTLERPPSNHPMFKLKLNEREEKCRIYTNKINFFKRQAQAWYNYLITYKQCPSLWKTLKMGYFSKSVKSVECSIMDAPRPHKFYIFARKAVWKWVFTNNWSHFKELPDLLIKLAYHILDQNGLKDWKQVVSLLEQSSCYGNDDATFMLATIFNHGLQVNVDEIKSHAYLLYGSMRSNRLSLLSLANKHVFNLDGVPLDLDQAWVYYMSAAYLTKMDLNVHEDDGTLTQFVRLTDEKVVNMQTDQDDDLFIWLKHQASQGIYSAQTSIARMLYWGSQGVQRNLSVASKYYEEATSSGNAVSLYDYGVILLRGHGVERNITKAVEYFQKAAAQNHSQSINTLGYHQLVYERNYTAAATYFERAFQLGNADAGHNLAHMLLTGIYPDLNRIERVLAWDFFSKAALRGNYDSGLLVAKYNMIGHPRTVRSSTLSVEWARYLAEQNPSVGKLLNNGVKQFRNQNWPAALVYYLMAASTGVEVANFNLAFLCDENYEYLTSAIVKDCVWRHYNMSTMRSDKRDNPYAWLKMADYHYSRKDIKLAAQTYKEAAMYGDAQALFNLGVMVEDGVKVPDDVWKSLKIPFITTRNNEALLCHIYEKCKNSEISEAYIPCSIALIRVKIIYFWKRHGLKIMSSVIATMISLLIFFIYRFVERCRSRNHVMDLS